MEVTRDSSGGTTGIVYMQDKDCQLRRGSVHRVLGRPCIALPEVECLLLCKDPSNTLLRLYGVTGRPFRSVYGDGEVVSRYYLSGEVPGDGTSPGPDDEFLTVLGVECFHTPLFLAQSTLP